MYSVGFVQEFVELWLPSYIISGNINDNQIGYVMIASEFFF